MLPARSSRKILLQTPTALKQNNSKMMTTGMIASMLRVADFGIQSLQMRDTEPAPSQRNDIFTNIEAIHTVQDTEGNTSSYALNMAEESDGTNSYFKPIEVVKGAG